MGWESGILAFFNTLSSNCEPVTSASPTMRIYVRLCVSAKWHLLNAIYDLWYVVHLQKGGVCFWGYTLRSFRVISHKYGRHSKNLHLYCDGRFAESSIEDKSVSGRERGESKISIFAIFALKSKQKAPAPTDSRARPPVHGPRSPRYPGSPPSPPVRSGSSTGPGGRTTEGVARSFSGQSGAGAELPRKKLQLFSTSGIQDLHSHLM